MRSNSGEDGQLQAGEKRFCQMKLNSKQVPFSPYTYGLGLGAHGLPAAAAPTTSSESSSSAQSVEVKSDAAGRDTAVEKTVTKDSSTTKQQQ
jgi:hypothetical protein